MTINKLTSGNNDTITRLAHLLKQKSLNKLLYEKQSIPAYMYERVNETLSDKIDELERCCYTCI